MASRKMHADELDTDVSLVRRLVATQFPRWADLPIERVLSSGTVNAIYRLGQDMAVRLPRRRAAWAIDDLDTELRWLPKLAPHLPLAIPVPLAIGHPGAGYARHWSIYTWLEGEKATIDRIGDLREAAADLARFVVALQKIDAADGRRPRPGGRGRPLAERDRAVRAAIDALGQLVDPHAVTAVWEAGLRVPGWQGPPVWFHGDLYSENLLAVRCRLSAVIDFGCLGVGDPACDLIAAWALFTGESREVFRTILSVDEATWARGRGWALSWALIVFPYYLDTNPILVSLSRHVIDEVLADVFS